MMYEMILVKRIKGCPEKNTVRYTITNKRYPVGEKMTDEEGEIEIIYCKPLDE